MQRDQIWVCIIKSKKLCNRNKRTALDKVCIKFSDGHIVLGCSDLTGRLWTGSLWYYKEPKDAPSVQKALTGVDCDSGVIDGKFIGNRTNDVRQ